MKALLYTVALVFLANYCFGQKVPHIYQIRADTVRIYNTCDTAEFVLENRTKDTLGFLFNKGNGRTEFRRLGLERIGASQLAIKGQDTIDLNFSSFGDTRYDLLSTNFITIPSGDSLLFAQWPNMKVVGYDAYSSPDMPALSSQAIQGMGNKTYYNGLVVRDVNSGFDFAVNWDGELNGPNGAFLRTKDDTKTAWSKWRELLFKDYADTTYAPRNASGSYIQNQTTADQPSSGFRISGIGRSNSQFQVVKNGSESLSPSLQLFNAAATRGANMQLDGNTNPGLSFWLQDGTAWNRSMTLTANGKLGLGTANPLFGMHITGKPGCIILETTSPFSGGSGGFFEAFNRGVPTAANQRLGGMAMGAMPDSLSLAPTTVIDAFSEAAWTNNVSHPTYLRFLTTPANSTQPLERMRINANGTVTMFNIPALGTAGANFLSSNGGVISSRTAAQVLADIGAAPATESGNYVQNLSTATGTQTANFSINGSGYAGTALSSPLMSSNNSAAQLSLVGGATGSGSARGGEIDLLAGGFATTPGEILFRTGTGTGGTQQPERMRIDASGKVGIGTNTPLAKLTVSGPSTSELFVMNTNIFATNSGAFARFYNTGTPGAANQVFGGIIMGSNPSAGVYRTAAQIAATSDTAWTDGTSHPSNLVFYTVSKSTVNPVERMRIAANGYVGINKSSPTATLDVMGNGKFSSSITAPLLSSETNSLLVFIGGSILDYRGAQLDLYAGNNTTNTGMMIFRTGTGAGSSPQPERMRITATGNLIVGTTVDGGQKLQVSGTTSTQKVIVTTPTAYDITHNNQSVAKDATTNELVPYDGNVADFLTLSTSITLSTAEYYIKSTSTAYTVTVPSASANPGRVYVIKNSGGTTGDITLNVTTNAQTIDGVGTNVVIMPGVWIRIVSNGTAWFKVGG